jgi:hypothetical protein
MIKDGRTFALTIALQHLLRALERKNVFSTLEIITMLDGVLNELPSFKLAPVANADAHNSVGALYLPKK